MDLATLEEIRQLKYRYLRCVDLKRWDEIADTFAADATAWPVRARREGFVPAPGRAVA
ncbi:MAG TPA: nuclear transport factor 2 family protein [Streptosporangiaceae bacterium]|jgi:3-phenylpropionate/cinnamic acid dioxygenase small subunit|nr:nuclear transport factor 2 family protein [Streptosporangiaceae bacterium]